MVGGLVLGGCSLCKSTPPSYFPVCITVQSTARLNWFRGAAHTVFVRAFALSATEAFEAAKVDTLLADQAPFIPGMVGSPQQADVHPATETTFRLDKAGDQTFGSVGVVAGYYQPLGKSKIVVATKDTPTGTCFVVKLGEAGIDEDVATATPTPH